MGGSYFLGINLDKSPLDLEAAKCENVPNIDAPRIWVHKAKMLRAFPGTSKIDHKYESTMLVDAFLECSVLVSEMLMFFFQMIQVGATCFRSFKSMGRRVEKLGRLEMDRKYRFKSIQTLVLGSDMGPKMGCAIW